jgi:hypothetical protein
MTRPCEQHDLFALSQPKDGKGNAASTGAIAALQGGLSIKPMNALKRDKAKPRQIGQSPFRAPFPFQR